MSDVRTSSAFLHIGAKKTGKTFGTIEIAMDMLTNQRKSVLIYDPNNQSEYDRFTRIRITGVPKFFEKYNQDKGTPLDKPKLVVCRDAEVREMFDTIFTYVRNAVIVFEDSTPYMAGNLPDYIQRVIFQSRNHGNDLIFNVHSLTEPAPFLFRHTEYIILRQTADNPHKLPTKVPVPFKIKKAMLDIRAENEQLYPGPTQPKLARRLINIQALSEED